MDELCIIYPSPDFKAVVQSMCTLILAHTISIQKKKKNLNRHHIMDQTDMVCGTVLKSKMAEAGCIFHCWSSELLIHPSEGKAYSKWRKEKVWRIWRRGHTLQEVTDNVERDENTFVCFSNFKYSRLSLRHWNRSESPARRKGKTKKFRGFHQKTSNQKRNEMFVLTGTDWAWANIIYLSSLAEIKHSLSVCLQFLKPFFFFCPGHIVGNSTEEKKHGNSSASKML